MSDFEETPEHLGTFPLVESKRILASLKEANIAFEGEIDENAIKNLNPAATRIFGGTSGLGCQVRIYVSHEQLAAARAILERLYPL